MPLPNLNNLLLLLATLTLSCAQTEDHFTAITTEEGIEISEGDSKVLFYQVKPKSLNGKYKRAHYVHPLYSLDGNVITEDFPEDHPHHHGIFSAWHQIFINNKPIADGWTSENISWEVEDTKINKQKETITLDSEVLWRSLLDGDQQENIVRENSKITVHLANDQYRIIDFDFTLFALADSLKIGGSDDAKGYGGFSLRLKLPEDIRFLANDKEVFAHELAVEAGPWLDFTGSFEGENAPESGVAVFCHPSNPGSPQPWILRKEKSMQNPAFPGRVPVDLTEEGWHFRYRVVIHKSGLGQSDIGKLYQEYLKQ